MSIFCTARWRCISLTHTTSVLAAWAVESLQLAEHDHDNVHGIPIFIHDQYRSLINSYQCTVFLGSYILLNRFNRPGLYTVWAFLKLRVLDPNNTLGRFFPFAIKVKCSIKVYLLKLSIGSRLMLLEGGGQGFDLWGKLFGKASRLKLFDNMIKKKVRKFCVRRAKIPRKNHSKIANLTWRALSQLPLGIKPSLICENHQNVTFWLSGHGGFTKKKMAEGLR